MSTFSELTPHTQARIAVAADWQLRLKNDPALEISSEFLEWISDDKNCRAYRAVEEGYAALEDIGALPEILEMRRDALRRAHHVGTRRWLPKAWVARAAAAIVAVAMLGSGVLYMVLHNANVYETGVGERRIVALPDGSRISLDSDTEVQVHYTEHARTLDLDRGRARFDVAHDVTRPFTVTAGTETVVAVGTSFNVEKIGKKILVTLIQGHVVIKSAVPEDEPKEKSKPPVSLTAGQKMVASLDNKPVVAQANLQAATAWEAGHLVFEDTTLAEAVARVNRYTEKPVIVDPSVADLHISGVFNAGDVGSFVSAVTSYFPILATTTSDNDILLQRRS